MKKPFATLITSGALLLSSLTVTAGTTSKWGPDDEIGAANLITEKSVLSASRLIKTGKTYALGMSVG